MVERRTPRTEVERMLEDLDRMIGAPGRFVRFGPRAIIPTGGAPVDIFDDGERIVVRAMLPGAKPDDIDIVVERNTVTIRGHYGFQMDEEEAQRVTWYRREIGRREFSESFALPEPVTAEQAEATFTGGILTLKLPKAPEARARHIPVRSSAVGSAEPPANG